MLGAFRLKTYGQLAAFNYLQRVQGKSSVIGFWDYWDRECDQHQRDGWEAAAQAVILEADRRRLMGVKVQER